MWFVMKNYVWGRTYELTFCVGHFMRPLVTVCLDGSCIYDTSRRTLSFSSGGSCRFEKSNLWWVVWWIGRYLYLFPVVTYIVGERTFDDS